MENINVIGKYIFYLNVLNTRVFDIIEIMGENYNDTLKLAKEKFVELHPDYNILENIKVIDYEIKQTKIDTISHNKK